MDDMNKLRRLNPSGLPINDVAHLLNLELGKLHRFYFGITITHRAPNGQPIIPWDDIDQARQFLVDQPADVPAKVIPYSLFADIEALMNSIAAVKMDFDDGDLSQYQNYLGSRKIALDKLRSLLDPDSEFVEAVDEAFSSMHGQYS